MAVLEISDFHVGRKGQVLMGGRQAFRIKSLPVGRHMAVLIPGSLVSVPGSSACCTIGLCLLDRHGIVRLPLDRVRRGLHAPLPDGLLGGKPIDRLDAAGEGPLKGGFYRLESEFPDTVHHFRRAGGELIASLYHIGCGLHRTLGYVVRELDDGTRRDREARGCKEAALNQAGPEKESHHHNRRSLLLIGPFGQ